MAKLLEQQQFWKALFEQENIASQLISLSTHHPNGVLYELPNFGQVRVKAAPASAVGDNFMSDTFSVTAQVSRKNTDSNILTFKTFIKILPSNSILRQLASEAFVHLREINMYHTFFNILREICPDESVPLYIPDVYYVHFEEIVKDGPDGSGTCILLEDLKDSGYVMSNKVGGADYRHTKLALTSLAHYHALTLTALRKWTDPETGECSKIPQEGAFILEKTLYDNGSYVYLVREWGTSMVDFANDVNRPDLANWLSELLTRMDELMPFEDLKNSGPLGCILHGDFWNNNLLFKYEESVNENGTKTGPVPVAIKVIDFQVSRIGHPLSDILYFMYTSTMPEMREKHMTELLRHYFDTLMADTKFLGVHIDNYSFEEFMVEYKKRSLSWLFMGAMIMAVSINKDVATNIEDISKADKKNEVKPELDLESEETPDGTSNKTENMVKNMITTKLSDSSILTPRLLGLILEVKALNNS